MNIGFWCIRNPWNTCLALDEFGPGTLDGITNGQIAYDACGPAALENVQAAYELRLPVYRNIGASRVHMFAAGQWAKVSGVFPVYTNSKTDGCFIDNVAWQAAQLGLDVLVLQPYQDAIISEDQVRAVLNYRVASIWIVTNAASLAGNEQTVHNHFVAIAGYGGDVPDGASGKIYLLNSDIAGQHGTATGQWMPVSEFLVAQPHGYAVIGPKPPIIVPPPLDVAGITNDLVVMQRYLQDALDRIRAPHA